jgi:hypothetical protein
MCILLLPPGVNPIAGNKYITLITEFARRRNRLTTPFSERVLAVKRRMTVLAMRSPPLHPPLLPEVSTTANGRHSITNDVTWGVNKEVGVSKGLKHNFLQGY